MKKAILSVFALMLTLAPLAVSAQWQGVGTGIATTTNTNLTTTTTVAGMITFAIRWLLYILAGVALLAFIIAGFLYVTAGGDEGKVDKAKGIITYAIIGVLVALLGLVIIRMVSSFAGGGSANVGSF